MLTRGSGGGWSEVDGDWGNSDDGNDNDTDDIYLTYSFFENGSSFDYYSDSSNLT